MPGEQDYDRALFSTPVRRLADKTQVFPLERNASVRNRLTHSLEVSNLARSVGVRLVHHKGWEKTDPSKSRAVPAILAAAGLCHDLGNPPFGHRGEAAIGSWFASNSEAVFEWSGGVMPPELREDFLKFEGNAQTLRLVARLQRPTHDTGLRLTFATLGALCKYTVSNRWKSSNVVVAASQKKHGFFESERDIATQVFGELKLTEGQRHPLASLMEACDDICYNMIDSEDAVKKGIVSVQDLISFLETQNNGEIKDELLATVAKNGRSYFEEYRTMNLSSKEINDVTTQRIRVDVVSWCLHEALEVFKANEDEILRGDYAKELLEASRAAKLIKVLKSFCVLHAFRDRSVKEVELKAYFALRQLMDILWKGIYWKERLMLQDSEVTRDSPLEEYVYSRISEGYRREYEEQVKSTKTGSSLPVRYRSLQLLTDMVSGMTDSFLMDLSEDLSARDAYYRRS